jgi:phospholipid/cholesterol/gamma-HCH transport system substrate-binding protein
VNWSAVEGVGRLSTTISSRDGALRSLLAHADQFTEILADRSDDFTAIVRDGNTLFAELVKRREEIRSLLVNVSTMSEQLSGLVDDNQAIAGPTLHQLNGVIKTLQRNKTNLSKTLSGLSVYATGLGEVVSSGPFFTAYLQNLAPGNLLAPTLDLDGLGLPGLPGLPTLKDLQNAGVRR